MNKMLMKRNLIHFVDKYIICKNDQSHEMRELVNLQTHRHAKTCKKGGHKICRFNFPLPSVPRSMILEPLKETHFKEDELKEMKQHYDQFKNFLDEMKYGQDIAFETFLEKLKLGEDQYLKAIGYSLKRPTLFLKRSSFEIRINNYNPNLLKAWRANMDLQFVLDPYVCAVYKLSYITKGQRGQRHMKSQFVKLLIGCIWIHVRMLMQLSPKPIEA